MEMSSTAVFTTVDRTDLRFAANPRREHRRHWFDQRTLGGYDVSRAVGHQTDERPAHGRNDYFFKPGLFERGHAQENTQRQQRQKLASKRHHSPDRPVHVCHRGHSFRRWHNLFDRIERQRELTAGDVERDQHFRAEVGGCGRGGRHDLPCPRLRPYLQRTRGERGVEHHLDVEYLDRAARGLESARQPFVRTGSKLNPVRLDAVDFDRYERVHGIDSDGRGRVAGEYDCTGCRAGHRVDAAEQAAQADERQNCATKIRNAQEPWRSLRYARHGRNVNDFRYALGRQGIDLLF